MLLLVTGLRGGWVKALLITSTLFTIAWSVLHFSYFNLVLLVDNVMLLDGIKHWLWTLFALSCLRSDSDSFGRLMVRPISLIFMALPSIAIAFYFILLVPQLWQFVLAMITSLCVMILMELLYRQSGEQKWAYKPLVLYFGGLALFDFVTYANASMVAQLGENYIQARGYIYVAMLPFLVLAIRRVTVWGVQIYVSRDVVLHSTLLMVAGAYLFCMALIGYLVKFLGGSWDYTLQLVLIGLSVILLLSVFLSDQFRTNVKVFITKHFYANQFDYRDEWVKLTDILSNNPVDHKAVYQSSLQGFLQAIDYTQGCLIKVERNNYQVLASVNSINEITHSKASVFSSLSGYFTQRRWIIDRKELLSKPQNYAEIQNVSAVIEHLPEQIIVPIFRQEKLWGMVMMSADHANTRSLNWELRDYLNAVTEQIANYIFHYETAQDLAENAQFAAFNRMSAFVLHDLKNVMAQINLILANAQQHKHNPEFIDDTFETLEYTKIRISKMLNQLTDKNTGQTNSIRRTNIVDAVKRVIELQCQSITPLPVLIADGDAFFELDAEKFSNVMYHLISNAQQATTNDGEVRIEISKVASGDNQQFVQIKVVDTGAGMTPEFIQTRLFKPFDTTKGNAGMGIGAYDAKHYIEEIGGRITVDSEVGKGTTFTLAFSASQ